MTTPTTSSIFLYVLCISFDFCIIILLIFIFRILVDRAFTPQNAILEQLDLSSSNTATGIHREYITYIRERKM